LPATQSIFAGPLSAWKRSVHTEFDPVRTEFDPVNTEFDGALWS
jgi:hypothetical protein